MKKVITANFKILILLLSITLFALSCSADKTDPVPPSEPETQAPGGEESGGEESGGEESGGEESGGEESGGEESGGEESGGEESGGEESGGEESGGEESGIEESTEVAGPVLLKINCGGPEVTIGEETFIADTYFNGPTIIYETTSVTEIADTELDEIYLTERITDNDHNQDPFSYDIPVSNGTYTIKLHFAEIFWGVPNPFNLEGGEGSRLFGVKIEDTAIFNNFDLYQTTDGPAKALTKMYNFEVTDGQLNIIFQSTVDKPKISAIEIFGEGAIETN